LFEVVIHAFRSVAAERAQGVAAQDMIGENAIQMGCTDMSIVGRRDFGRALKKHGWKETHVRMTRHLT